MRICYADEKKQKAVLDLTDEQGLVLKQLKKARGILYVWLPSGLFRAC